MDTSESSTMKMAASCARKTTWTYSMMEGFLLVLHLLVGCMLVSAVDKNNFKTCSQSSFCQRNRDLKSGNSPYEALMDTLKISDDLLQLVVLNSATGGKLQLELIGLDQSIVRLRIKDPFNRRYEVPDVVQPDLQKSRWKVVQSSGSLEAKLPQDVTVRLTPHPLRLDLLQKDDVVISVNSRGLMNYELQSEKKSPRSPEQEGLGAGEEDPEEPNNWEETFKTHKDSRPKGPTSVGVDFCFPGFDHVYGIPEHADTFALKTTVSTDPYRLYNLDVFEYELYNPMALYGSVPYMLAHNSERTVGLLWLNAAETWIDISSNTADKSMFNRMLDLVRDTEVPQVDTHWFSESGILDVFFFMGPTAEEVMYQYALVTGMPQFPPLFAIAYHQSRWNYNDEDDVKSVDAKFDEHDIPCDVIWLDIEHTDGKRYMTWDSHKFSHPEEMQNQVAAKGRKFVASADPHLKRDDNYRMYREARELDLMIKNPDGSEYEGWCWPGSSSYPDFTRADTRNWWAEQLSLENYKGSTPHLFTWNDMNEPSVFNGPEVTMHKDAIHQDGWEHRDVHNLYGLYVHMATVDGQHRRSNGKERSFVLSRAFFTGSQKYGAIWTGDNEASWEHLKISMPMLLSISIAGIPFIGADVGGFFKNPEPELLTRWYQAAAFQPFFRAHAHLDTKRREPWLLPPNMMDVVRMAIRTRYALLPYWYTAFYKASKTGQPVMRPMWLAFPDDPKTFAMEDQFMIGDSLLVEPVTSKGASSVSVYFPGQDTIWYDVKTAQKYTGPSTQTIYVNLEKIPVFQRGGTIVPRKERVRRCSFLGIEDPYTLIVALDTKHQASGQLYMDDGHSLDFKSGFFQYKHISFQNNVIQSRSLDMNARYKTKSWLERVVVLGMEKSPSSIQLSGDLIETHNVEFSFNEDSKVLVIRKPEVNMATDWVMTLRQ
ncbi:neutral alpha-glucosidase AB-like isoform X2 [Acanthaster planci]|uniref:Neutral alpha-glucosidase AB n=1 Tax=Acanthaster planci TaxID=133434 RepID=A0A8B7XMJ3_ACAPL|nr:neutral alpha-glucosidase AB-like isoform X2 [Acanthaster planci]